MKSAEDVEKVIRSAARPPSPLPDDKWLEEHYEIQRGSGRGRPQFGFLPIALILLKYMNRTVSPWVVRVVVMACAQSAKTETVLMYLCRRIAERPIDAMWATATKTSAKDFMTKALQGSIRSCRPALEFAPPDSKWTKALLMFSNGMRLMMRGSESRIELQGDPIGLLICDERREWKRGAIDMIRKRTRTMSDALEISMGVAGEENDELDRDWKDGSQTFVHWNCPGCKHSQPFRFGRDASALFPDDRKQGGVIWDDNETTHPGGKWDYDEVEKSARYQCEECGRLFGNHEKLDLLQSAHEFHRNPKALKQGLISIHWNALYMPWQSCTFGAIAVEFLKAMAALKVGDIEPLKAFVTETSGEPWQVRNRKKAEGEVLNRRGEYVMGEMILKDPAAPDSRIAPAGHPLILTFDRQRQELKYVIRQWMPGGRSRLVTCGAVPHYDDLRALQLKWRIPSNTIHGQKGRANGHVYGDDGGKLTTEFRQACVRYGWIPLKGDHYKHYTSYVDMDDGTKKAVYSGWRATEFDLGIGKMAQTNATIAAWMFSSFWFKEKLYCNFLKGVGPVWEIPIDIPDQYVKELSADSLEEKKAADGSTETYFAENDVNDFGDCEVMQLVVADIAGITRLLPKAA